MKYFFIVPIILILVDLVLRKNLYKREIIRENILKSNKSRIIRFLTPKEDTKDRENLENLIKKSRLDITCETFSLITILTVITVLIFSSLIVYTKQKIKLEEVFNKKSIELNLINYEKTIGSDDAFLNKMTKFAHEKIKYNDLIKNKEYKLLQQQIYNLVKKEGLDKEYTFKYAEKVYNNLIYLNKSKITYKTILIVIFISLASMLFPITLLRIRVKMTEQMMEIELNKLEIMALLLLKKEDFNIYKILLKLKSKSNVFKPYLTKCVNDYQKGGKKAMEVMQKEVDYKPFTDFINILKLGIDTNKHLTSNVLEMTRNLRNDIYKATLRDRNKKKSIKIVLTRFPMIIVFLYLLLLPIIVVFKESIK